jgi:hypothetical protein
MIAFSIFLGMNIQFFNPEDVTENWHNDNMPR